MFSLLFPLHQPDADHEEHDADHGQNDQVYDSVVEVAGDHDVPQAVVQVRERGYLGDVSSGTTA